MPVSCPQTLSAVVSCVTRSNTSSALEELSGQRLDRREELALKRRSYPAGPTPGANPTGGAARPGLGMGNSLDAGDAKERPIRFAVRSLGWVEIAEADLTPERSSKAVNKCIVDLSLGRNDLLDVVGRWGDVSRVVVPDRTDTFWYFKSSESHRLEFSFSGQGSVHGP